MKIFPAARDLYDHGIPASSRTPPSRKNARDAIARHSQMLRMNANDADAWHALGTALATLGDRAGAFVALRNAVLLDGSRAHTHLALGNLLFDTGRLDDALRCFACAAERDPAISHGET